jgi:hypothetical protein
MKNFLAKLWEIIFMRSICFQPEYGLKVLNNNEQHFENNRFCGNKTLSSSQTANGLVIYSLDVEMEFLNSKHTKFVLNHHLLLRYSS